MMFRVASPEAIQQIRVGPRVWANFWHPLAVNMLPKLSVREVSQRAALPLAPRLL